MSKAKRRASVIHFKSVQEFITYLEGLTHLPKNFNRPINKKHAKKLAKAIEEFGLLRALIVIRTSCFTGEEVNYIGDGQHLRYALINYVDPKKIAGLVSVVIVDLENKDEVIPLISSLNSTASNWSMMNYLNGWCADGKEDYLYLKEIMKNTKFGLAALVEAFLGERPNGNEIFKKGKLKLKRATGHRLLKDYDNACSVGLFRCYKSFQAYIRIRTDYKNLHPTELLHIIADQDMFAKPELNRELFFYYFREGISKLEVQEIKHTKAILRKAAKAELV